MTNAAMQVNGEIGCRRYCGDLPNTHACVLYMLHVGRPTHSRLSHTDESGLRFLNWFSNILIVNVFGNFVIFYFYFQELSRMFNDSDSFYYSPTGDLTNSVQVKSTRNPQEAHLPRWALADDRFFYNKYMLQELLASKVIPSSNTWRCKKDESFLKVLSTRLDFHYCHNTVKIHVIYILTWSFSEPAGWSLARASYTRLCSDRNMRNGSREWEGQLPKFRQPIRYWHRV